MTERAAASFGYIQAVPIPELRRRYASGVHPRACECVRWAMWGPADLEHIARTGHHPNCPLDPEARR